MMLMMTTSLLIISPTPTHATTRVYYIAAEEIIWNYLPTGLDCMHGTPLATGDANITSPIGCPAKSNHTASGSHDDDDMMKPHGHSAAKFHTQSHDNVLGAGAEVKIEHSPEKWIQQGPQRIGRRYMKVHYQEYTDHTFTVRKNRTDEEKHLGLLGPIIRGVVGDTLMIVFHNRAKQAYSFHPHGVFYTKSSEGSPYADDATASTGDSVPAGGNFTYTFLVPERAGPGPNDPSSVMWLYHSHVDEVADTNAGLIGVIIITRAGWANEDATPIDVDRELVVSLTVYDESESAYFMENIHMFLNNSYNPSFGTPWVQELIESSEFLDSNEKHAINGYLYANLPGLYMEVEDRVRWYTFALGSEEGFHTAHWHGQTVVSYGQRVDTVAVLPATTHIADMVPDNEGLWMFHCHVNHHIHAGMTSLYEVSDSTKPVPHTVHNEPVAPWVWLVIVLILLVPMTVFGGMFAKTYMPATPPVNYAAAPQMSPRNSLRNSSTSQRSRNTSNNNNMNGNGSTNGHRSPPVAVAVNDERKEAHAAVVVARAKITGFGASSSSLSSSSSSSPTNEAKLTEKRGIGLATGTTTLSGGSSIDESPLASPPYQLARDVVSPSPSPSTTSRGNRGSGTGAMLTVHAEPLPVAVAAALPSSSPSSNHLVVALDVFGQQSQSSLQI